MEPIHCNWLVLLVVHDFNEPAFDEIIQMVLREFELEGSIRENKVLLLRNKVVIGTNEVTFNTQFLSLEQNSNVPDNPLEFSFQPIPVPSLVFDITKKRAWEILLHQINQIYLSKRTIMITLCHGAGVGLTGAPEITGTNGNNHPASSPKASNPFNIVHSPNRVIPSEFIAPEIVKKINKNKGKLKNCIVAEKYLVTKRDPDEEFCKMKEILWISELAKALENGFGSRKIDIMMMANCHMQTLETGWLLRNQVRYLVAPETVFKAYGYSFSGLLRRLNQTPNIKTTDLLKTIIPDYIEKMKGKDMDGKDIEEQHMKMSSVVINDLAFYDEIKFLFEQIACILKKCTKKQLEQITAIRNTIQNSSDYPLNDINKGGGNAITYEYVDYKFLLSKLQPVFENDPNFRLITRLYNRVSKRATLHMYTGDDYIRHDQFMNRQFGLHGISIFMPRNKKAATQAETINCAYFGVKHVSVKTGENIPLKPFVSTSFWDDFVKNYIMHLSSTNGNNQ